MPSPPASILSLLQPSAALFTAPTWREDRRCCWLGAILAPRQAHCVFGTAGAGSACAAGFCPLPPCAQPGGVVVAGVEPGACWACWCSHLAPATGPLCVGIDKSIDRRKGPRLSGQRSLSGWGVFLPWALCKGRWDCGGTV